MDREEIYRFMRENPFFALATSDGTIPHVRTVKMHKVDETGIYFMVGKFKDVYRQLSLNPAVELCFTDNDCQVRVSGTVENLDRDEELKKEILNDRPFMKSWIEQFGLKYMAVFRLRNGTAITWTIETELKPKEPILL